MKTLIVEDDQDSAGFLCRLLEQEGHEAVIVDNGEQVWRRLQAEKFSLVLTEWLMPEMDGLELTRRIRSQNSTNYIYVILISTKAKREDRLSALQAGADDFLTKPLDREELLARLIGAQRLLDREDELKRKTAELKRMNEELERINELNEKYVEEIRANCRELELANAQFKAQSITDGLTGLKNHLEYQERLEEEIHRAVRYRLPLSLIMLDVDNFKQYNDTFGHPAGDEVLVGVARILQNHARDTDRLARYGGEEFTIILANTDHESALAAAERFRNEIAKAEWKHAPITVSLGIATLRQIPQTRTELTTEADKALYCSKRHGRNCVTHFEDIQERSDSRTRSAQIDQVDKEFSDSTAK